MLKKIHCDHGQIFFFFVSDTDLAVGLCLIVLTVLHAVPRCAMLCHIVDSANHSGHCVIVWVYICRHVCVSCRRRRLVKVGLGRPKPRRRLVDFGNVLCYYMPRVYQDLPTRATKPKPPCRFASRAQDPLPILTTSHCGSRPATVCLYQTLPPDPTKPNTPMVLHVSTPTNPYHVTA